jgi:hypothetical protein
MFVTAVLIPGNYRHQDCTVLAVNLTTEDKRVLFNNAVNSYDDTAWLADI